MLDRASTCLETGGRQLLRAPKPCLRTRRILHSNIWYQGSADQSPAICLPAPTIRESPSVEVAHGQPNRKYAPSTTLHHDSVLLDFLYPKKTLALLRRLSAYGADPIEPRRRQWMGTGVRRLSTVGLPTEKDEVMWESEEETQAKQEMAEMLRKSTAKGALWQLLRASEPRKQELAWHLYCVVSDRDRTPELRAALLSYLMLTGSSTNATRAIQIFDNFPVSARDASSYKAAVSAYVTLQMIGPAIQIYEEAAGMFDTLHIGTDTILARLIRDDQWELSLRVLRTFLRHADRVAFDTDGQKARRDFHKFIPVWGLVDQIPFLQEHFSSLLHYIRQFPHELRVTEDVRKSLTLFVIGFMPHFLDSIINSQSPDENEIWDFFTMLFRDLQALRLPTAEVYEYAISRMLSPGSRYQKYTNQRKIHLQLYRQFQQDSLRHPGPYNKPSRELIGRLIVQHGRHGSLKRIKAMMSDLYTFHGEAPFSARILTYLITHFARHGDVDGLQTLFNEFVSKYKEKVNLPLLSFLVYAYARRVDLAGAQQQFTRIRTEFGLEPDRTCWNNLLLAYTRADDLEGALQCFNNLSEAEIKPDKYTYGPLLDLCAKRGDVEAAEALLAKARQSDIQVDSAVWFRSVYVQTLLNDGDPEGAEEVANRMLRSAKAGALDGRPLTYTWNLLIQHYAIDGDIATCRRLYTQMMEQKIPFDSWTFSGLMRALIQSNQTNAAYKMLRTTMVEKNIRVHAFHYALVMVGFVRERQYKLAMHAYERMVKRQIPQTRSSRQASIIVKGIMGVMKIAGEEIENEDLKQEQLRELQETLRRDILSGWENDLVDEQPSFTRYMDSPEIHSIPQGYFGLLIILFSNQGAYTLCKEMFEAAVKEDKGDYGAAVSLLTALMEAYSRAGEFDEVDKCWEFARSQADEMTKTFSQVMAPPDPTPDSDVLVDPEIKKRFNESRIANNRRQIIHRASRLYIRSLLEREDLASFKKAQRTIRNLLTHGYVVDTLTWNEIIQALARRQQIFDAFAACEEYLMPSFPGWRDVNPHYIRRDRPGHLWMELRHYDIGKTSIVPRYKTLVILAAAFARIKRDESNGLGYDYSERAWKREILERIAPMTVRALETMPDTGDRLQRAHLHEL